jgi:peptidoglycan/xylan/chitin deacetylase (PgdA/CDA1 family)
MAKRIFNLMVSLLVRWGDGLRDGISRLFGQTPRARCVVLAYHSVTSGEREAFARQMDVLLAAARPVAAGVDCLPEEGGRYAAVTFDDGFENIVENALPELEKRKIPATLFVVTEALGTARGWEHRGGDDTRQERVMSVECLSQLPSELVTVGSHSMTHPMLPLIEKKQALEELRGSRLKLEKIVNREVKLFSFPYGAFNDGVVESCREAGYGRVFTALPVFAFSRPGEFVSGRAGTAPTDWPLEFRLKLAGAYRWQPYAFAMKRRVLAALRGHAQKPLELGEKSVA